MWRLTPASEIFDPLPRASGVGVVGLGRFVSEFSWADDTLLWGTNIPSGLWIKVFGETFGQREVPL